MAVLFYTTLKREYGMFSPHTTVKSSSPSKATLSTTRKEKAPEFDYSKNGESSSGTTISTSARKKRRHSALFNHNRKDGLRLLHLPSLSDPAVKDFIKVAASVAFAALWRMVTYAGATSIVASTLPTVAVAAHKVVYEVYFTCSFLSETGLH